MDGTPRYKVHNVVAGDDILAVTTVEQDAQIYQNQGDIIQLSTDQANFQYSTQTDIQGIKSDITTLKTNYDNVRGDTDTVQQTLSTVQTNVGTIQNDVANKVAISQGVANAGKALVVGSDGNVTTGEAGVSVDTTLTVAGKAADAKATGDAISGATDGIADEVTSNVTATINSAEYKAEIASQIPGVSTIKVTGANPVIDAVASTRYICEGDKGGYVESITINPPSEGIAFVRFIPKYDGIPFTCNVQFPTWINTNGFKAQNAYEVYVEDGSYGMVVEWPIQQT